MIALSPKIELDVLQRRLRSVWGNWKTKAFGCCCAALSALAFCLKSSGYLPKIASSCWLPCCLGGSGLAITTHPDPIRYGSETKKQRTRCPYLIKLSCPSQLISCTLLQRKWSNSTFTINCPVQYSTRQVTRVCPNV